MPENTTITQTSTLPPAQPAYILRGHTAQVHSVLFLRDNLRLLSGDADGWVVLWSVPIRRPVAVWRAHSHTILGLADWDGDKIITHGRDCKLLVWQLPEGQKGSYSTVLPIDDAVTERRKPPLLHSLLVNTLNFCSFAILQSPPAGPTTGDVNPQPSSILVACPGVQDGQVIVTALPNEERIATLPEPKDLKTGMVMALRLERTETQHLHVLVGYESGHVSVWRRKTDSQVFWERMYTYKAHSQPVLSLDFAASLSCFYTSSADAIVARHPLLETGAETKVVQTKHAGQQALTVRSDEKLFATAGWDGRIRVYSAKTMKELAVLKWHKEGCYALAFANMGVRNEHGSPPGEKAVVSSNAIKRELTVSEQRTARAKLTHWVAAGSKDGKISLWDIF